MKRLIALVPLVAMLTALVLLGVADTTASVADTSIPDNKVTNNVSETDRPDLVSATITIRRQTYQRT